MIFTQARQANDMYITNISFYKDLSTDYYDYDNHGNLISITKSNNESNLFNYDNSNQLISITTPKGKNFKYERDNVHHNRILNAISSNGISNKVKYNADGNPIMTKILKTCDYQSIDGLYRIRSKGTNNYLKLVGNSLSMFEDTCSNTVWNFTGINDKYKLNYYLRENYYLNHSDDLLNISFIDSNNEFVLERANNGSYYIKYEYFLPNDDVPRYRFLKAGDLLEFVDFESDNPQFEFYFETVNTKFIENDATYTADGRFISEIKDSLMRKTIYVTDPITGLLVTETNPNGDIITYQYNNKKQITSYTIGNKNISYAYNSNNLLSKITQGNRDYNISYDEFMNVINVKIGDDITLVSNEYEPNNGNLKSITYGNNQAINYMYDEFGRISKIIKIDFTYEFIYDSNGNLAKVLVNSTNSNQSSSMQQILTRGGNSNTRDTSEPIQEMNKWYDSIYKYVYDPLKRVIGYENDDYRINYEYDTNSNVTIKHYNLKNNSLVLENTYDMDDNILSTTVDNTIFNYTYDELGRLVKSDIDGDYDVVYGYKSVGNRTSTLIDKYSDGNNVYSYDYDNLNNITEIYYNNNLIKQYEYDINNQLVKENNIDNDTIVEYTYDTYGNLQSKTIKNALTLQIINTINFSYSNSNWQDQLTSFNNMQISYDAIGNPITIGNNISMTWNNGRQLNSYSDTSKNLNVNYKYNEKGIRISKTINNIETKYYLDNSNIIFEERGNDLIEYIYNLTGLIGLKYNNNMYYYSKNIHGDVVGILDSNYNQIVTYEYDSWGKIISIKDSTGNNIVDSNNIGLINPFRYRSYYYDEETKLYYLNHRYYNPEWCRFINADTIICSNGDITSHNLYLYVSNNPINYTDDMGTSFIIKKLIKTVVKSVVRIAADIFFSKSENTLTKDMFQKAMGRDVSETKINTQIISKTSKSQEINSIIANSIASTNSNSFETNNYQQELIFTDDSDLHLSIHNASYEMYGEKISKETWKIELHIYDTYDFTRLDYSDFSLAKVANGLGYTLQYSTALEPYKWSVEYCMLYNE